MRLNGYDYEFTQLACDYVKKGNCQEIDDYVNEQLNDIGNCYAYLTQARVSDFSEAMREGNTDIWGIARYFLSHEIGDNLIND